MRKILTYLLAVIAIVSVRMDAHAQDADSLILALDRAREDTVRMRLQFDICDLLLFSDPSRASDYCGQAFISAAWNKDTLKMAKAANYEGIIASLQAHHLTGIEKFQEAIRLYTAVGDEQGVAKLLNNIGVIYSLLENYRESIEYYKECYNLNLKLGDHELATYNLFNIAGDYLELEEYGNAKMYIDSLVSYQERNGKFLSESTVLGDWYLAKNKLDSAEKHLYKSLEFHRGEDEDHQIVNDHLSLARLFLKKGYYKTATNYLDSAEISARNNNLNSEVISSLEIRAELYEDLGLYEEAFETQKQYVELNDSLDEINNFNRISELNTRFESEKKEQELKEKEAMLLQQESEKRAQKNIFLLVLAFIIVVLLLLSIGFIRKKKTNLLLNKQNGEIRAQRKKIIGSINYAQKIQSSILLPEEEIQRHLKDAFVYFRPKDIVSGDFYWFTTIDKKIFLATIDCTGHGVPGAFMSLIAHSKLNKVVKEMGYVDPGNILTHVHKEIMESLNQEGNSNGMQDGMDMSFCVIDPEKSEVRYAGARNPIILVSNNTTKEIKPDNLSIGGNFFHERQNNGKGFTTQAISVKSGDCLYLFTDGYIDQFGGPDNKKLNKKRFHQMLIDMSRNGFGGSKTWLDEKLQGWMGANEQIDDILIIGTRF